MNVHEDDPILLQLSRLRRAAPDVLRTERTARRCRAVLARRARPSGPPPESRTFLRRILEPAIIAGFSLAYVVALVHNLLRWRGLL